MRPTWNDRGRGGAWIPAVPLLAAFASLVALACSADGGSSAPAQDELPSAGGAPLASGGVPSGAGGIAGAPPAVPGAGGMPLVTGAGGTSGGGVSGSLAGAGGLSPTPAQPFGGYDPNVTFDWPEVAATAGACKAGRYQGKFDGIYLSPVAASFPVPIAGDVSLVLEQSQDGEFFTVADGNIVGTVYGFIPFSSGLVGTLNCRSGTLEGGFMPGGKYTFFGVDYFYEGPIDASYDRLTSSFVNGTWAVGEPTYRRGDPLPPNGGQGTWGASWVGP